MTEQTLKPCPFCGGKAALKEDRDTTALAIQRFFVTCDQLVPGRLPRRKCFAAMGENYDRDGMPDHMYSSADQAIAAWNARAEPMSLERARAIVETLNQCRDALKDNRIGTYDMDDGDLYEKFRIAAERAEKLAEAIARVMLEGT